METKVTIPERHLPILTDADLKDEYMSGITSILQGEEPQASCPFMEDVFLNLVHGHKPKIIPGIPKFDPSGMRDSELDRYKKVQAGMVPSTGLDYSYTDLKFKPVTGLDKGYLNELYNDCQDRIQDKTHTPNYRRFISYLAEVMEHCADSGEVL
jgi:hypothetical protein